MLTRAKLLATAALLAMTASATACSTTPSPSSPTPSSASQKPVTVSDLTGHEVTLAAPARKVVCLDGACIDALAELGLEPVASAQFNQVTSPLYFGQGTQIKRLGGTFFEPDLEGVLAAAPDLVIGASGVHAGIRDALGGIPLYLNKIAQNASAVDNLKNIAKLTGREAQAEEAIKRYQATLSGYKPGQRPTVLLSMYGGATDDIGIDAADSSTGSLLAKYSAYPWPKANEGDGGFLEVAVETLLDTNPDYIWVLDFGFDPKAEPLLKRLAADARWQQLKAVKNGHVYQANPAWWGSAAGTRGQQAVLDTVMPTVYPGEFPKPLSGLRIGT